MYLEISFSIIDEVIKYYLFNSLVTNDRFCHTDKKIHFTQTEKYSWTC